ncbi:MAG: proton-conducting transporter membrane subunit, partial [Bryobacteraceae bacterium]
CSALTQYDLKRALAYSTISQIGYMFLALGVGAWSAAIFHFMTHAFFKALLFLCAGVVIEALHHEHDMYRMGGLRKRLPVAFWTFLIAGCSLAGLPLFTAGYWSKDLIIWNAYSAQHGSPVLWWAALVGAFLTALYTFRMVFLVFFGELKMAPIHLPGYRMKVPLIVLAVFSVAAGYLKWPLLPYLETALPAALVMHSGVLTETYSEITAALAFAFGVYFAYLFFLRMPGLVRNAVANPAGRAIHAFWFSDWGFDWLYDKAFVQPVLWAARTGKRDFVDLIYVGLAGIARMLYRDLSLTESGRVRWYAASIAAGTIVFVALALFL